MRFCRVLNERVLVQRETAGEERRVFPDITSRVQFISCSSLRSSSIGVYYGHQEYNRFCDARSRPTPLALAPRGRRV